MFPPMSKVSASFSPKEQWNGCFQIFAQASEKTWRNICKIKPILETISAIQTRLIIMSKATTYNNEKFWPVPDHDGYFASRSGKVYAAKSKRCMKEHLNGAYIAVSVSGRPRVLHRIIAKTFVPNELNLPMVNHKDCNKRNNAASNLEWCSGLDNTRHASKNGLLNPLKRPVRQYTSKGEYITSFESIRVAGIETNIGEGLIGVACRRLNMAGGYRWMYDNDTRDVIKPNGNNQKVEQIDLKTKKVITVHESIKVASLATGAPITHIGSVCRGKRNSSGGFGWRFIPKVVPKESDFHKDWKIIEGHPTYKISPCGKVYSIVMKKVLNPKPEPRGYIHVKLNRKHHSVHCLVAKHYIPNPDNLSEVNHLDGNKTNNVATNLEWASHAQNIQHAVDTGLWVHKRKKIVAYLFDAVIDVYDSAKDAARDMGVIKESIYAAVAGRVIYCKGLQFGYLVEDK
jgi:hypothetical protein